MDPTDQVTGSNLPCANFHRNRSDTIGALLSFERSLSPQLGRPRTVQRPTWLCMLLSGSLQVLCLIKPRDHALLSLHWEMNPLQGLRGLKQKSEKLPKTVLVFSAGNQDDVGNNMKAQEWHRPRCESQLDHAEPLFPSQLSENKKNIPH